MQGLASTAADELYSGILQPPYTPLSPAPVESLLPSLGLYMAMSIGLAAAPAAVRIFGEERDVFKREAASGHSIAAYFLAKNTAALYRSALAALHFAAFFALLARPTSPFPWLLAIVWGIFWGTVGLAQAVSMAVSRANAALLAVVACLVAACLCGFGPTLAQGRDWGIAFFQDLSYAR